MISHKVIGEFTLSVWDPTPIWIEVTHGGNTLRFHQDELQDLIYALRCAEIDVCGAKP